MLKVIVNVVQHLVQVVQRWVQHLASIMATRPNNRTVIVVSDNTEFQQLQLNWMVSAVLKANASLEADSCC